MAFIPNYPQVGDKAYLTRDARIAAGVFTRGHEFTIRRIESSGMRVEYGMVDNDNRWLYLSERGGFQKEPIIDTSALDRQR